MRNVTKRKIKELSDKDILIDTFINPFSEDSEFYKKSKEDMFTGVGVFDRFTDLYVTTPSPKGLLLYNMDIPYLHAYILPWKNIKDIVKNSDFVKANNIIHVDDTFEVSLINNEKILLPLCSKAIEHWEYDRNIEEKSG